MNTSHCQIPTSACPACGYVMDTTTGISGEKKPSPGDVSLCLGCGKFLLFDEELRMRQPDPMELLRYQLSPVWKDVERGQLAIRAIGRSRR